MMIHKKWDVFICHASEDKDDIARPLAKALEKYGLFVWYDEFSLKLGDSLSQSIDNGLSYSDHGVVILSHNFFNKNWTKVEINSLITKEVTTHKSIIPIWYNITQEEILIHSPILADKIAIKSSDYTLNEIAIQLVKVSRPDIFTKIIRRVFYPQPSPVLVEIRD